MSHKSEQYVTNPKPRLLYQSWGSNALSPCLQQFSCPPASHSVTYAIERLNHSWYQLAWDENDKTYYTNALQEVVASNPIHPKAIDNSAPTTLRTMHVSQDMTTGSEPPYDQSEVSKGKELAHSGSSQVHPSLFGQFVSLGPEPTAQMATNADDFERQKRAWFHEWSAAQ